MPVTRRQWLRYVELQKKGEFSMLELPRRFPDEFSPEDLLYIIRNFEELQTRYSPNVLFHPCAACGVESSHRCGGCKELYYCSKKCQKRHWTKGGHSRECREQTTVIVFGKKDLESLEETEYCSVCMAQLEEGADFVKVSVSDNSDLFQVRFCSRECNAKGHRRCNMLNHSNIINTAEKAKAKTYRPSSDLFATCVSMRVRFPNVCSLDQTVFDILVSIFGSNKDKEHEALRKWCRLENVINAEYIPK